MKNFNYLFIGILMIGMGFTLVLPAVARSDYQARKLESVGEYHLRQFQMEDLIKRQMSDGMDFEASYLKAKQMRSFRESRLTGYSGRLELSDLNGSVVPTAVESKYNGETKISAVVTEQLSVQSPHGREVVAVSTEGFLNEARTDENFTRQSRQELTDMSSGDSKISEEFLSSARAAQIVRAKEMAEEYRNERANNFSGQIQQTASDSVVLAQSTGDDLEKFSDHMGLADKESDAMDIRDLTIQDLRQGSRFDQDYAEAFKHDYHLKLESDSALSSRAEAGVFEVIQGTDLGVTAGVGVMIPEEIIRQVIAQENRSRRMDLHFDQTNLGDVMMTLGETGGINIVLDPAFYANKLDLHLKQVSLEEAMMLLSNIYDLGFEKVGESLYVTHKDKLSDRKMESRVVKLRNIGVSDARLLVKDLAHTVNASEELNSLVIIGSPEQLVRIESVLTQVDVPQPQVIIEAKILEINKDALKDLGVDWSDQIILQYQEADRPQSFESSVSGSFVENVFEIGKIARNAIQFETTIKMLENQNKAKILSNPRVTTLNGKEAEIFVGDKIPYTITNVTGGVVTTDVRFVEPGIRLKITPSIIDQEFVILRVDPEVSFIFAFRGPNDEYPQVKSREATAHVRVKNQTPFVIGGLLNQEDKQSLFKVPFLGNVPLIGNLFSYQKNSVADTELIITILPTIVTGSMQ